MVIKAGSAPFVCGACGTRHEENRSHLFYLCNACEFLIHPDCASLPNAINLMHHQHSLLLTYGQYEKPRRDNACAICKGDIQSLGAYVCVKCKYFAHIHCAISNPQSFKSVLIRDAKVADLLHFPLSENTSVMPYISENTGSSSSSVDDRDQIEGKLAPEVLHQHPLIQIDGGSSGDESMSPRVCNACVQLISPPFYSCSECPDFFLHSCCANLPSQIQHRAHQHPLSLFPKAPNSFAFGFFWCDGCSDTSNKFAYSCNTCRFQVDVVCASLPPAITHELHGNNTHILYMFGGLSFLICNLCNSKRADIAYKCINCHDFAIDARCTMFPSSVKHKYDEHPLKLTIDNEDEHICEICEETIESRERFYSCSHHCDQSFHSHCIPSVNRSSRIKLGGTIHVDRHDCPLTLVLQSTVSGYHCGYCLETFSCPTAYDETPVYECSKCYFRIHDYCAEECLL